MKANLKPVLRFKGFEEAWRRQNIDSICSDVFGGGTPNTSVANYWDGVIPWIQSSDLDENQITSVKNRKHISELGLRKTATKLIPGNSIAVVTRVGVGKLALMQEAYSTSQDFVSISNLLTSPIFTVYSIWIRLQAEKQIVQGTSIKGVTKEELLNKTICVPDELREQEKLGAYFQKLDGLIAQHQQKHDKLLKVKKSLLDRMFPKKGSTTPCIRFQEFAGEWEVRHLASLAEIVRGASPRPIEDPKWFDSNADVGWLRIKDVTQQDGRIFFLDQKISVLGEQKTRVLKSSHLLLSIAASVGKPVINYVNTGVHDGFLIFSNPLFQIEFMYQWLKSFEGKWQKYGQPGSQINLNSDIVKQQELCIPSTDEQKKIGALLKKLDALITQHEKQLKKLKNIKQACLAKMFV